MKIQLLIVFHLIIKSVCGHISMLTWFRSPAAYQDEKRMGGRFGRSNVCWWKVWESRRALYLIAAEVNRLRLILWIFTPFIGGGRRRRRRARRKEVRWLAGTGSTTWGSTLGGTQLGTFCGVGPCHPVYWLDLLQRVQRPPNIYRLYKTVCATCSLSVS